MNLLVRYAKAKKTLICNQDQCVKPPKQHLQTEKHKKIVDLSNMKDAYVRDTSKFEIKLLKMLLKNNVPLSILNSESFNPFSVLDAYKRHFFPSHFFGRI
jgi:hypothetical protein